MLGGKPVAGQRVACRETASAGGLLLFGGGKPVGWEEACRKVASASARAACRFLCAVRHNRHKSERGLGVENGTGTATASMVVGIVAVAGEWVVGLPWLICLVLGVVAVGLASNGLKRCPTGRPGHGQAVAGLVLGVVAVAFSGLFLLCLCVGAGVSVGLLGLAVL